MRILAHGEAVRPRNPIEIALSAGQNSPEKLPGLLSIFNELPIALAEELKNISFIPMKITSLPLEAGRFGEAVPLPTCAAVTVVTVRQLKGSVLFACDFDAAFLFVEAALGYNFVVPSTATKRELTAAEYNVLHVLFRRLARSLSHVFSRVADVVFEITSVIEPRTLEPICSPSAATLVASIKLDIGGKYGMLYIAIPQDLLTPVRGVLGVSHAHQAASTDEADDSDWSQQLSAELARAFVSVSAVLTEETISLADVQRLSVGSLLPLSITTTGRARLEFESEPIFWCELGKRDGSLTLRIDQNYMQDEPDSEFLDGH